ncbi:HAD family acid phosphatase [Mycoplasmopsis columbinasalis]|uniref:5'-nucleotidase, lipoprotein e(P4) family n=1 Tax=Mycoplasmopsis columbinasalis TaxID=114880 RepID=A0A449BAP7_9BACT|nr:HAD family acid phosphatase [Mycoplasmopsis columbinasalis]VEU78269.1 5'-nucleotidase, lipoprotein e(P4) family [Mycoplasmopsis columbinasalis]
MKFKKLILTGSTVLAGALPFTMIACNNSKPDQDINAQFASLSNDEKKRFITDAISEFELENDAKADLINTILKDAGTYGAVIWYIKSVESYLGKVQAYEQAKFGLDNLRKPADTVSTPESTDSIVQFDWSQNFNTAQKVDDPASDKVIPVVFMDIDETVLQNDYTEAYAMLNGGFKTEVKETFDAKGFRREVPGAVDFINYTQEHGALVMYNSDTNLSKTTLEGIKKNLKALGVKYVADFQFWMRGAMPYTPKNAADLTDEKTKNLSADEAKALAKNTTFTKEFNKTPWKAWENWKVAEAIGRSIYKNDRMNAVDNNTNGWDFNQTDNKSGKNVKLKVVMKIGDNFNDFFDRRTKGLSNEDRKKVYLEETNGALMKLFALGGSKGLSFDYESAQKDDFDDKNKLKDPKKFWKNLSYNQAYVMIPGNAEYGGWAEPYGYGEFKKFYEAMKKIAETPDYQKAPTDNKPIL